MEPATHVEHEPLERRPLASRSWKISGRAAEKLARAGVSPNAISVAGMLAGIGAGAALASTSFAGEPWARAGWIIGALLVQARLAANMLDGMVAVATRRTSSVGELYNEIPDRVSDIAVLVGLGYAAGGEPILGWAAACAAVLTAYVRAMGKAAGAPQDYCGPMAKPHRMFAVTVTAIYCGFAPAAWQPVLGSGAGPLEGTRGLAALALGIILAGSIATASRRVLRIAARLGNAAGSAPP